MAETPDPFAAPEAPPALAVEERLPFEPVPAWKIAVLMPATAGFYAVYWFYRNFRRRQLLGENISALGRALFHVFFTHRLLRQVAAANGVGEGAFSGLATGYVIALVVGRIYDRTTLHTPPGVVGDLLVPLAIVGVRAFLLVRAQEHVDEALDLVAPQRDRNQGVGVGLAILLAVLAVVWSLVALGTVFPEG